VGFGGAAGILNINTGGLVSAPALQGGNALSSINFNGGTLRITGSNSSAHTFNLLVGGGTFDIPTAASFTISSAISGAGSLTKTGVATLWLSGTTANTFVGGAVINGGVVVLGKTVGVNAVGTGAITIGDGSGGVGADVLQLQNANQIPNTVAVTINSSGEFDLNNNNETVGSIASTASGALVSVGTATLTVGGNNTSTGYNGEITGSGLIVKTGSGTWTLGVTNRAFTGKITVLDGLVTPGTDLRLGMPPASFVADKITLNGGGLGSVSGGAYALHANRGVTLGASGGTIDVTNANITIPGAVSGSGALAVEGTTGVIAMLSGTSANTYTGTTTVNGGTLRLNKSAAVNAVGSGAITIGDGSGGVGADVLQLQSANQIPDSVAITINSSGQLDLNNRNETVGSIASSSGNARVNVGTATLTTGGNDSSTTYTGDISGSGLIVKTGTGTWTLTTTARTFTGKMTIVEGFVAPGLDSRLGTPPGSFVADQLTLNGGGLAAAVGSPYSLHANRGVTIGPSGGTIDVTNANITIPGAISGSGILNVIGTAGVATLSSASNNGTFNGALQVNGNLALNESLTATHLTGSASGSIAVASSKTLTVGNDTVFSDFSGVISGAGSFTKVGDATQALSGANTYSGGTTVSAGILNARNTTGSATGSGDVTVDIGASLVIGNGGANGAVSGDITNNGTLTFNRSDSTTYAGQIMGSGAVNVTSGIITLSAANTYTGDTTIGVGTLVTDNISGSATGMGDVIVNDDGTLAGTGAVAGNVAINNGGTLRGTMTISGEVTVADGGTVAPGASPGTLTINDSLVLNPATNLAYDLLGTNQTVGMNVNDLITGVADLTLDGLLFVAETVAGSFLSAQAGDEWRLIEYTGQLEDETLSFGSVPTLSAGLGFTIDTSTPGQVNLAVVAVPEASAFLCGTALFGLFASLVGLRRLHQLASHSTEAQTLIDGKQSAPRID
jgi:fibronectin-binding autotransporter adhesin